MCLVIRAYLDNQENVCSQISVSTYNGKKKQWKCTYAWIVYSIFTVCIQYLYKIEQDYHYIHLQSSFLKHSPYHKVFALSMSIQTIAIQISRSSLNPTTHMCWTCRLCWYCTCSRDMQTHTRTHTILLELEPLLFH